MPEVRRTVGRYEVLRRIGRGGMAVVELARQTDLDRFVALKQLKVLDDEDPSYAQRFLRESRVASSLSHPNIVTVYDYFEHEGTPYIAMEYVNGGSLRPYLGEMTLAQSIGVLEAVLAGLTHAESKGVVHRDLKPENLMVSSEGRVKIADFGIAKATHQVETAAFKTRTGTTVGTPTYMAPEQAMAQNLGPWTDLYSVGCIAFEMFTGRVPFHDSAEPMAVLLRQINEPIPPVASVVEGFDPRLSDWTQQLLVKDPAERTRSASVAGEDLEEIVLDLKGPRWRREARLVVQPGRDTEVPPLTPAPFEESRSPGAEGTSDSFESFDWGVPGAPASEPAPTTPQPYTPPPRDLPPGPMLPPEEMVPPEPAMGPDGYETYDEPPPPTPPERTGDLPLPERAAGEPRAEPGIAPEARAEPEIAPEARAEPQIAPEEIPPPARVDTPPARLQPADLGATAPPMRPPPQPARDAPTSDPHRRRRRWGLVAAAATCVALVGVAFAVAPASRDQTGLEQAVEGRGMAFDVPDGWTVGERANIAGLDLRDEVAARPPGAPPDEVVSGGFSATRDPSLLPDELVEELTNQRVMPTTVETPAGVAYRYAGLRTRGSDVPLTLVALPTADGVATLACRGRPGSDAARSCDAISQTLELPARKVYSPAPSSAYATALNKAIGRLTRAEAGAQDRLQGEARATVIAREASGLADAYGAAARSIDQIDAAPFEARQTEVIRKQLQSLEGAYGRVARAAGDRDRSAYAAERARAREARAALGPRLERLGELGHEVQVES